MKRLNFKIPIKKRVNPLLIFFFLFSNSFVFGQFADPTVTAEVTSDIPIVVNCPCAEVTVNVTNNSTFPEQFSVRVNFPNNGFNSDDLPPYFTEIPNTEGDVTTSFIVFEPGETKSFVLKGEVTTPNLVTGFGRVFRPNNQFFNDGFNIQPETSFVEIDGTDPANPASLQELIDAGVLIDQSEACTFDQNPSPEFQSIFVRGVLEIDTDYCFKRNPGDGVEDGPFIMLDTDAKIVVKDGNELTIRRHVLGCVQMFDGIYVEENATLNVTGSIIQDGKNGVRALKGSIINVTHSTFRDNYIGLKFDGEFFTGLPPNIQLNKFYNNKIFGTGSLKRPYSDLKRPFAGIELTETGSVNLTSGSPQAENHFSNMLNGIIGHDASFQVEYARFFDIKGSDQNPSSINGYGIYFNGEGISGGNGILDIKSNDGWVNGDPSFSNCDVGIHVNTGIAIISGQKMIKVNTGIEIFNINNFQVIDVVENWIEPVNYGLDFFNVMVSQFNRCFNNYIFMNALGENDERGTAMRFNFVEKTEIMRNTIELWEGENGISIFSGGLLNIWENSILFPNDIHDQYYGMILAGSTGRVRCNYIKGNADLDFDGMGQINEGTSDYKSSVGLSIRNTILEAKCNDIQTNKYGIQAWGMNQPSLVRGNILSENFHSLLLGDTDPITQIPDGNAWIGPQGNSSGNLLHNGNRWLTNNWINDTPGNNVFGAVHFGSPDIIGESIFRINSDVNQFGNEEFLPSVSTPNAANSNWFEDEVNNAFECVIAPANSDCSSGIGDPDLFFSAPNETEIKIAKGQIIATDGDDLIEKSINWLMARNLYRKLLKNDNILTSYTDMQSFVAQNGSSTVGQFYNIDQGIIAAIDLDPLNISILESFNEDINDYYEAINGLNALFDDDILQSEYESITNQKKILTNTIHPIFIARKNLIDQHRAERKTQIEDLILENSNITCTYIFEENEKLINDIFLNYFFEPTEQISIEILDQIRLVASQCPLRGGNAVYKARAMLSPFEKIEFNDVAFCQQSTAKREAGKAVASLLTVYPNPAYDQLTIEFPEKLILEQASSLNLVNSMGQFVISKKIESDTKKVELNIEGLPSGLYTCVLMLENQTKYYKKVMILNH